MSADTPYADLTYGDGRYGGKLALTGNANFNAALANVSRQPVYYLRFEDNTTIQFTSGVVTGTTKTDKKYLNVPEGIAQKIDFTKMVTTISGFSFNLLDKDAYVTDFIYDLDTAALASPTTKTPGLNHKITLGTGFVGLDEADFIEIDGYVDSYQYTGTSWAFKCRNIGRVTKQKVFKSARSSLAFNISAGATSITLANGGGALFANGDVVKIDDELILLGGGSSDTYATCTRGYDLTYASSDAASHSSGDSVVEVQIITGHPMTIIETNILTNELGIAGGDIDGDSFDDVRDHWSSGSSMTFYIVEPGGVDAKKFCEDQILVPNSAYFVFGGDGEIGVNIVKPVFPDETGTAIDEDKLTDMTLARYNRDMVNAVEIYYDFDIISEKYRAQALVAEGNSASLYDKVNTIKWELKGVRTAEDGLGLISRAGSRLFQMAAYSSPPLSGTMSFQNFLWEAGDAAEVSHANLPDLSDGTRGFTSQYMVISKIKPNYKAGNITVEFRNTGLTTTGTYAKIGTSGDDWGDADATERLYGFVGRDNVSPG